MAMDIVLELRLKLWVGLVLRTRTKIRCATTFEFGHS